MGKRTSHCSSLPTMYSNPPPPPPPPPPPFQDLARLAKEHDFDVIYDMNGREMTDTKPLADAYKGRVDHFVYMSSAGVYLKSDIMPHKETDATDPKSRHKGKLGKVYNHPFIPVHMASQPSTHLAPNDSPLVDPRHSLHSTETETYLAEAGLPFTSIRPTYIYGPQNYNPVEVREDEGNARWHPTHSLSYDPVRNPTRTGVLL